MKSIQPNKFYYLISGCIFAFMGMFFLIKPPVATTLINHRFFLFFAIVLLALAVMRFVAAHKLYKNEKNNS